jgi:hypothetical protein
MVVVGLMRIDTALAGMGVSAFREPPRQSTDCGNTSNVMADGAVSDEGHQRLCRSSRSYADECSDAVGGPTRV